MTLGGDFLHFFQLVMLYSCKDSYKTENFEQKHDLKKSVELAGVELRLRKRRVSRYLLYMVKIFPVK